MEFPISFHIGSFVITAHSIFEFLAYLIGFRYFLYLRKNQGDQISNPIRTWVIIGAIFGSLIGSRLIGSLERPYELSLTNDLISYFYNNKTILGGLLGGLIGVEITKNVIKEKRATGDLFVYPLLLALIIGRIGCFSMGVYEETYGNATNFPLAMNLGDQIPRHPVALYEIIYLTLVWFFLKTINRKKILEHGALFKLFMISYLLFRLLLDFIKPHYSYIFGFSIIQLTSIAGLFYYLPYIVYPKKLITLYA